MTSLLDMLIDEQRKDDTTRVWSVSLDAYPSGVDLFQRRSRQLVTDPRHGTLNCYIHLGCRCEKCRKAQADAKREWRRRQPKKRRLPDRLCCAECGSENVKRKRVYV